MAALLSTPSIAGEAANAVAAGKDAAMTAAATGSRVLYVCDKSIMTRRAFAREYGTSMFVTADEALGTRWAGPRCITRSEMLKLRRAEGGLGRVTFETSSATPIIGY